MKHPLKDNRAVSSDRIEHLTLEDVQRKHKKYSPAKLMEVK